MNLEQQLNEITGKKYGKNIGDCDNAQLYDCVLQLAKDRLDAKERIKGDKKVYYISMEFLIGKLLSNNLINLGIYEELEAVLGKYQKNLSEIEEEEPEPSLGNGGLGRLAACFLDSIATLGLSGDGIGLNYHFGLFKQVFRDRLQRAEKNDWIGKNSWLNDTGVSFEVEFGKKKVVSELYDIDVVGYGNGVNKLHLFDLKTLDETLVKQGIDFDKEAVDKNLTLFLYPDDSDEAGNKLRIYQEYFMVSNGAQLILKEQKELGHDLHRLNDYVAVQINDTHPTMVIPELIRLLTQKEGFSMDEAIDVVSKTCAYTNHTILAEALETWPMSYLEEVVPQLVGVIRELDARIKKKYSDPKVQIISREEIKVKIENKADAKGVSKASVKKEETGRADADEEGRSAGKQTDLKADGKPDGKNGEGKKPETKELEQYETKYVEKVHMAHIDIHYGFSVNGVAAIHTDILKETELNHFYRIYPEKFNNKTNGITFRRWLLACNRELTDFLVETIGDGFKRNADELEKLLDRVSDQAVLDRISEIKQNKKRELAAYIQEKEGIEVNADSIFDIQIKRLHEYKRQQMNALYIIHKYLEIKRGKKPETPITFLFGAKAAPAYVIAQDIIHLILVLEEIVNHDPDVSPYMKVIMVENYNVSYAEKLIPACDISEQISLASKEASGTGNMKFMLNGAVTLGTSDGANVEIHELVGDDNIYIFGKDSDTVIGHYAKKDYVSREYYEKSPVIKEAVDFIVGKEAMKVGHRENLERLYKELLNKDWFMTLLDLEDYIRVKEQAFKDYGDRRKWQKMMLTNIAKAGFFSSDRTIREYNRDIWKF